MPPAPVLVTGATGRQGGAVARALLAAGAPVRALVRDQAKAGPLRDLGVEVVPGDLLDLDSVTRAARGAAAVFSVQMAPFADGRFDFDAEVAQASTLIAGAGAAGVTRFVHTSVSGAGQHADSPAWDWGRTSPVAPSLNAKAEIQDRVRAAGFDRWTIIKPAFFMDNFRPAMGFLFPRGVEGGIVSVLKPSTQVALVATADIGAAAAAALLDPDRFHGVELELASDRLPMSRIAEVLSEALGTPLRAPEMTEAEALAAGMPGMGASHEWMNRQGQPALPEFARALGIPLTSFADWARASLPE
ncbi:NmrA family NAD(P)-binding protein [Actinokineospora bangkokensis]|uniref:NmrA family protein n=1 Tax=Actinokineospora bangkokensis TaxID=1193682 RepID=A0A1Q9LMM3_9PSEU|nr:NmrA family NAD(P)-binding protein [Actinokineospora bangkokensis]OLR93253.1 NmrA family protein [Actinokineospora bangkokensis]